MPDHNRRLRLRLVWSTALATGALVSTALIAPSWGGSGDHDTRSLSEAYRQATKSRQYNAAVEKTKNAISRGGEPTGTEDPTTPEQAASARTGRPPSPSTSRPATSASTSSGTPTSSSSRATAPPSRPPKSRATTRCGR